MVERPRFHSVENAKLSSQISRQLISSIAQAHYKAGDRLPPERELASMFNVSRGVVREALASLMDKGILTVRQGRATTVSGLEEWSTLDGQVLLLRYGDCIFDQVSEVRRILEPEMAAMAARSITPELLEELRPLSDLPETDTVEQHAARDTAFHLAIAKASANLVLPILLTSISELLSEVRRRIFDVEGELHKARIWHHRIFDAIEQHDADLARSLMAGHMDQVTRALHDVVHTPGELQRKDGD
jgi:GntR family transcriptional repressor for pyruvate dehydrogenase complex